MTTPLYDIVRPVSEKFPDAMPEGMFWDKHLLLGKGAHVIDDGCEDSPFVISNDLAELAIIGAWVKWLCERQHTIDRPSGGRYWRVTNIHADDIYAPTLIESLAAAILAQEQP